jgi:hypothetical protein
MELKKTSGVSGKAQTRKGKRARTVPRLHRELDNPPQDRMIRQPEKKKEIWELLAQREKDLHSGERK